MPPKYYCAINHLGILVKYRLWFPETDVDLLISVTNRLLGDSDSVVHGPPLNHRTWLPGLPCGVWYVYVIAAQSCPTLCDPRDYGPPGSSVHGILQARILEWVAISFSRGSSRSRDSTLQEDSLPSEPPGQWLVQGVQVGPLVRN